MEQRQVGHTGLQGERDEAVSRMEQIMRTGAIHTEWYFLVFAKALFISGDYQCAEEILAKRARISVADSLLSSAVYIRHGQTERARKTMALCVRKYPDRSISYESKRQDTQIQPFWKIGWTR